MTKYLVCIAQKHTMIPEAICEIEFKASWKGHLSDIIKKAEEVTGIKVDGRTNYIEWVEV